MSRIEIVTECEHGKVDPHHYGPDRDSLRKRCPGGSRRVVDGPTNEMYEAAVEGILDRMGKQEHTLDEWNKAMAFARAALDAAWTVLTSTPSTECKHEWVDARNKIVSSGEWCRICNAVRPGPPSEMEMGPHQPAFGYSEPAELKDDR